MSEISSRQNGLEFALTNPTHTTPNGYIKHHLGYMDRGVFKLYSESQKYWRKYMANGIMFRGEHYLDSEQAYQKNKKKDNKEDNDLHDYMLMVDVLKCKLKTYQLLMEEIEGKGGQLYLDTLTHNPTNRKSRWETSGKNLFVIALSEAYNGIKNEDVNINI